MSYREMEEQQAREDARGCLCVLVAAFVIGGMIALTDMAGCGAGTVRAYETPSVEEIRNDDAPALVGLGYGTYAYPAWDRANNVCYLVVTRGDEIYVLPRLNPDGSVMVLEGE